MSLFDSVWSRLTPLDHVWPCLTVFNPFWPCLTQFVSLWPHLTPFDSIWPCLTQFDPLWPHLTPFDILILQNKKKLMHNINIKTTQCEQGMHTFATNMHKIVLVDMWLGLQHFYSKGLNVTIGLKPRIGHSMVLDLVSKWRPGLF